VFLSEIRNYSSAAARRIEITVGVAYKEDTARVMKIIRNSLVETPFVLVEPSPDVYIDNLGDSAVNINIWCWVPFSVWFDMKKQLVQQIKRELENNGIEIPFPQRVVYLAKEGNKGSQTAGQHVTNEIRGGPNLDEYSQQNE
jgi:small-conductance mechanosensitive channel